ncbi:MAG: hypothetical protein MI784_04010 [Cytophagales bacterium]|nr:hypothetical protein [Cytophagales bacterium]
MKTRLILGLIAFTLCVACGKDEQEEPDFTFRALTARSWTMVSYHTDPPLVIDSMEASELMEFMRECQRDDRLTFRKSGEFSWDHGALECTDDSVQAVFFHPDSILRTQIVSDGRRGNWKFEDDGSVLVFIDANTNVTRRVEVMEISPALLKFRYHMRKNYQIHTVTKMFYHPE